MKKAKGQNGQHRRSRVADPPEPPDHFCCPISFGLMKNPVSAVDGHTYERAFIEQWLQQNNTSPMTNLPPPAKTLTPNHALRKAIQAWTQQQEANASSAAANMQSVSLALTRPKSVLRLSRVFRGLDPIREQLKSVLEGWEPPVVVTIGGESAGKSTILERIAMTPLFPKGKTMTTRLPILISLRNVETNEQPCLQVMQRSRGFGNGHKKRGQRSRHNTRLTTVTTGRVGRGGRGGRGGQNSSGDVAVWCWSYCSVLGYY